MDPNINRSEWTQQEDEQLVLLHAEVGNQWAVLARSMPGRTDNAIKNRWNATLHKRMLSGDYNYLLQKGQCVWFLKTLHDSGTGVVPEVEVCWLPHRNCRVVRTVHV